MYLFYFFYSSVVFRVSNRLNHLVAEVQISLIAVKHILWISIETMIRFNQLNTMNYS